MTWFSPQISVPIAPQLNASAEDQQGLSDGFSPNEFLLQFLRSGGNEEQRTSNNEPNFWDPAVAAHGPSHSFPPHSSPARPLYMAPPPPPPPLPRFGGWSPHFQQQQDHVFPVNENPFLTPTDHGFLHPYALQVERPFHPPAPYPFPAPPVVAHEQKLRPIQQAFGPPNPEPPDAKRPIEQQWQGTQVETVKDGKQSVQQFHGAGAELLQLLQGGIVRSKLAASPVKNNDNGEASGENSKRGSPSTAHGPIGPPRRQVPSPPESPNDLLGRFWPVLPSSTLVFEETKPEQSPEGIDSLEKSENSCSQEVGNGTGIAGFSLLKRGSPKLPLDGFDCDSKVNEKQKMHLAPVKSHSRYLNGDAEFEQDNERSVGRRRNGGRGEVRRNGGRAMAGQWIAVNERPKDVDAADNVGSFDSKDEGGGYKSVNGTHSKMRDELKRRRKQQQEWRIKASESKIISNFDTKLPKARSLASQLEHPGLPSGSMDKNSAVGAALDESKQKLYNRMDSDVVDDEELTEYVANLEIDEEENGRRPLHLYRPKESRLRESKRYIPMHRRHITYRPDLQKFTRQLLSLYNDLIPTEEEEIRRRKFLFKLESLFEKELRGARLFLFGSCANAFGVRNSDIDVCLTVDEEEPNKIELVVKMASILESNDMENVQALTHARVPIVKFTEPMTGISCDICVNNMLAVVNSKLLHDYAQIDVRLLQLAFMVKHWAKRRQVNETYRGTLSSYAYVLMCIHFLQQRRPAILPCLQEMPHTYEVKVGNIRCAYYDKVETLRDYGAANKETLGELLTAFFDYWAYRHEYNHAVISVRTGGYLSKDEKEWTRRIGNERHLICIEDPFEITHDLGRVVDKHSIKALRGEFYRAANTMASDVNPCITLFEPYIREQHINHKKVLSSDNI